MSTDLLTIDEQPDRFVTIFGVRYLLRRREDLSVAEEQRFARAMRVIARVTAKDDADITPQEAEELGAATRALAQLALNAPDDVMRRLKDGHCSQLATLAFFEGLLTSTADAQPAATTPSRRTSGPKATTRRPGGRSTT